MLKFILLACCLFFGALLRRTKWFDEKSPLVLNNLLVYFFIPILTLYHVPKINFEIQLIWLSITPFLIYASSFVFIKMANRINKMDKKTEGALIMCSGIGSISFVGFPVFELLYGEEGLSYGIILSLAGTFLVFNTVGILTGLSYSQQTSTDKFFLLKKMATFPPFFSFVVAGMINFSGILYPPGMDDVLMRLSAPFSVLALLAIGMQMDFSLDRSFLKTLFIGQFHKLIIAPLVIYVFLWHLIGITSVVAKVCLLGAAIGSMNAISIVAAQMGLNPKLATAMPAIGIPISIPILFLIENLIK